VHSPKNREELRALFEQAVSARTRLTLVGAQRSFGEQFLPPVGAHGVSLERLQGSVERLEQEEGGDLWVRAPGALSFHDLCAQAPGFVPYHPPTGDRISLGGALAACSHDAVGFFASSVRSVTVMTPQGEILECHRGATGLAGNLFPLIPGSFGALGAILSLELRLRQIKPAERAEINVLMRCPAAGYAALEGLEKVFQSKEFTLGRGLFFYGNRRQSVLLGDRLRVLPAGDSARALLLTDDATTRNIVVQALANRFPRLAHWLQPWVFNPGRRFQASLYGFSFYQRSYDRAHQYLSSGRFVPRLLRWLGIDPILPVCHQTFVVPVEARRNFLDTYFLLFRAYPDLEKRLEQQDMIRLPPCPYPLHAAHNLPDGCYLFTASFSVRKGHPEQGRCQQFLCEVSRKVHEEWGVKVLLVKQAHCPDDTLRVMHRPFITTLRAIKAEIDPNSVLTSRLLERLLT
jgi:hypothetical protein